MIPGPLPLIPDIIRSFSLSLGAAKELYDMHGGGQASGRDMAWNIIGTATGVGLAWVADIRW